MSRSDRDRSASRRPTPLSRRILSEGDFTVEELAGSDVGFSSDVEVVRPDSFEDAASNAEESQRSDSESRRDSIDAITLSIGGLNCGERSREQKMEKRRQRWSQGSLKRNLSTSLENDTDMEDVSGFNAREMAKNGRRQRLRTSRPEDATSLTPEDHIPDAWLEAEDSVEENQTRPTTSGSDTNGRAAETLPFFPLEDIMQLDKEPSGEATPR